MKTRLAIKLGAVALALGLLGWEAARWLSLLPALPGRWSSSAVDSNSHAGSINTNPSFS